MPSDQEHWSVPPESRRIAHPQKIYLKFSNSDKYVEEYLIDLSMTGMFVRCLNPAPPGTILDFRMRLVSGGTNVEGTAAVVWVRTEQQRISHPKGMGVRFLELGDESLRQIRGTVQRYARDPESPEEMSTLRSVVEETLGEVLGPDIRDEPGPWREMKRPEPPAAQPSAELPRPVETPRASTAPRASTEAAPSPASQSPPPPIPAYEERRAASIPSRKRGWTLALVLAFGLLALLVGGLSLRERWLAPSTGSELPEPGIPAVPLRPIPEPSTEAAGSPPADAEEIPGVPGASGAASSREAPVEPEVPPESPETTEQILKRQVMAWALAWTSQEVDSYLDFYARDFSPTRGLSGPQWRRQRRDRISGPGFIEVEVKDLQVERVDDDLARTRFVQFYRSDTLSDTTLKMIEWKLEDGAWKIIGERATN